MNTIKITNYKKSEIVDIKYLSDNTTYSYDLECKKLSRALLRIIERKEEVKIITKTLNK